MPIFQFPVLTTLDTQLSTFLTCMLIWCITPRASDCLDLVNNAYTAIICSCLDVHRLPLKNVAPCIVFPEMLMTGSCNCSDMRFCYTFWTLHDFDLVWVLTPSISFVRTSHLTSGQLNTEWSVLILTSFLWKSVSVLYNLHLVGLLDLDVFSHITCSCIWSIHSTCSHLGFL